MVPEGVHAKAALCAGSAAWQSASFRGSLRSALGSGGAPLVHLEELAQAGSEEQREFIRLAAASLSTFLKVLGNYPLPLELGGFR